MCFSAEADLVVGVVVTGMGIDAVRQVSHKREVALAALPLLFGAHQLIEAFIWWGLEGTVPVGVGEAATLVYVVIAFLLPIVVPLAVGAVERDPGRRRMVAPFAILGLAVTTVLLVAMATGPVDAEIANRYISDDVSLDYGGPITALYVIATCVPLLLSSRRARSIAGHRSDLAVVCVGRGGQPGDRHPPAHRRRPRRDAGLDQDLSREGILCPGGSGIPRDPCQKFAAPSLAFTLGPMYLPAVR